MQRFLEKYHDRIIGVLNGFDRLLFRGTLRRISSVQGLSTYLSHMGVLLKNFGEWSSALTERLRQASESAAAEARRPLHYINSPSLRKEELARTIAQRDGIDQGLICVLTAVEPCMSFDLHRSRERKRLELTARERKCLWVYHYMMHPQLGFMHARLQTWLPFTVKICINGHEWLARQMNAAGIDFVRKRNCFVDISDIAQAQQLAQEQLRTEWPRLLDSILAQISPLHQRAFHDYPLPYYWSADETEWSSDILFRSATHLSSLYPQLLRQAMVAFKSDDVMRFLGRLHPQKRSRPDFKGEVTTDAKRRPEGIRIKHRLNTNSIKMYNKEGSVLRVETTINNAREFKVFRPPSDNPRGPARWQRMRKGVADLHRRAQISQSCNQRYVQALGALHSGTTLAQAMQRLCRRVIHKARPYRALNPFSKDDRALLATVCRGEFAINGFRNRDLCRFMYPGSRRGTEHHRRRTAAKVTRLLGLLRAHGIIKKVPKTHRYILTSYGRQITSLLTLASDATSNKLKGLAA